MEILTAFANELANQMIFVQAFHPSLTNWLPFMWKGFKQTTHLGYVIEDLSDTEWLWAQVADKVRNNIRRAQKQGLKVIPCDIDLVTTMTERSFKQQHLPLPFARSYVARIFSASIANGSGACFAAIDATGQPHASMFIVWDHKRAYGITTGTNPQLRASGAESLLIWHVLKFSAERSRAFDFSGSVIEHLEKFFRNFGGRLISYNRILKMPWPTYPFYPNVRQLDRP
jgi:hypothetical protein